MLKNIQKTIFQIRDTLMNDEIMRKLVYNDSNNALEIAAPSVKEVEDYFSLSPVYEFNVDGDYDQNCAVSIFVSRTDADEDIVQADAVLLINVIVNNRKWVLDGQQIRPLAIVDRIVNLLCGKKFSVATPLSYQGATDLILTKQISGYALTFSMVDGAAEIENI